MQPFADESKKRTAEILAIGEMYSQYGGMRLANQILKRGGSKLDLMREIMKAAASMPLHKAADAVLGINSADKEFIGYDLSRAMRAAIERDWSKAGLERDISNLSTSQTGHVPNGFFVPLAFLARDFNVGTASEAGNLLGADVSADQRGDPLRRVSALSDLGATMLSALSTTLSLPRFSSTSTPVWKSEVAAAGTYATETATLELTPKRLPFTMVFSRQALLQSNAALGQTLGRHILTALMSQLEQSAINDDGTNDTPTGLRSTSGVAAVAGGINGAQLTYAHLCDLEDAPGDADALETEFSGFLVNAKTRRWLRTKERGTSLDYIWDGGERPLLGHRTAVSNIMPSNLTKGTSSGICSALVYSSDWSQFIVALYGGGVDLVLDRVTLADVGKVRITGTLLAGVGANQPANFSLMEDALTA